MTTPTAGAARLTHEKHFTSSILLWVRTDQPRQTGMDYWKGPHSGIISATPGLLEYRQIHLAADNPGRWPDVPGVETAIPVDRRIDGVAEVTFRSAVSPLFGRTQNKLAFKDEVNVFRRTLLYAGPPRSSRWYDVGGTGGEAISTGARTMLYLRRKGGVSGSRFRSVVKSDLVPALARSAELTELRTQTFLPWVEKLWDTPDVAHDNPTDQHLHASVSLGFADAAARSAFFAGEGVSSLSASLAEATAAVHAYDVEAALTFVKDGVVLPSYTE
ncbi:hypothetical protein GCM10023168_08490 [Fodinibacter luteus]|uniref:Strictosidine synthase n=1 Tax=Fodinibacter luteus TaxID=552064 RepID=A0ABP8K476_9MICO